MRLITSLGLVCGAVSLVHAMEVNDLRIGAGGYGVTNANWNETYWAGPASATGSGSDSGSDWDGDAIAALSLVYTQGQLPRSGGWLWAVGVESTAERHTSTVVGVPGQTVATSTFAVLGRFGYGVPMTPHIHLEIMPELQIGGLATDVYDTNGVTLERNTATGGYGAAGLHLGGYARVQRHLVLGLSVGVRRTAGHYDGDFASTGGRVDGALYGTQWGGRFELGVRF
jgi:hypothetical protein